MHGQYSRERLGDEQSKKAVTVSVLERKWKVPWGVSGRTWECQSGTELPVSYTHLTLPTNSLV